MGEIALFRLGDLGRVPCLLATSTTRRTGSKNKSYNRVRTECWNRISHTSRLRNQRILRTVSAGAFAWRAFSRSRVQPRRDGLSLWDLCSRASTRTPLFPTRNRSEIKASVLHKTAPDRRGNSPVFTLSVFRT